ncbi:L-2,4-diaminobutyrate decarboxylase [Marinococcus luteus]|uniref:L-2,4-diaminobutyrate decarboxylase n=1 Tax=Marinococcus luteus TaxID=1122204 RepID=A0A1H2X294_9BACI|nr:aspartate aminotransferase family protein [Marinococcus luteus]SDW86614.1 L-2,4-diaminobutyrate decarboxylase [Marinococcus luteus]
MPVVKEESHTAIDNEFLTNVGDKSRILEMLTQTSAYIAEFFNESERPVPAEAEVQVKQFFHGLEKENDFDSVLKEVMEHIMKCSLNISHPHAMAHLHCPPLLSGVCADVIVSALNQSMDSWDQSPAATTVETEVVNWLCELYQLPQTAAGTFTTGGTQSNFMGLLLARDQYCARELSHDVKADGLPAEAARFKIFCSEEAHFTVKKSAVQLGLGERSVVGVPTDEHKKMSTGKLEAFIQEARVAGDHPIAIVATAGTTDFGSIDPLQEIRRTADKENLWMHVDAAFGGALALCSAQAEKLDGVHKADSLAVDFHKLFYQPVSCGAFLVRSRDSFRFIRHGADYLNPEDDRDEGFTNLVDYSMQTTRRFDALKILMTLRTLGTEKWAEMIGQGLRQAGRLAEKINDEPELYLVMKPEMNAVVFKYCTETSFGEREEDEINREIQQQLYASGEAVIAKTKLNDRQFLKCTLLNPLTKEEDIDHVIQSVIETGREIEIIRRRKQQ